MREGMVERKVPVIDIREFPGPSHKPGEACEAWGCFRIVNHKIPLKLMSEMKAVVKSLLDLPSEHLAPSEINPLNEALGLYDLGFHHAVHAFCCQLDASLHQRGTIESYARATHKLVVDIAAKLAQTVELSGEPFKEWTCLLRMNKDNFTPETLGSSGVQVHTDSWLLTILQDDDNASGLDVMDSSGSFVALGPWPGTFPVNLGDLATIWSDGRWRNLKHCMPCKEAMTPTRVSTATFILGLKQGVVEAPPELVDPKHPCLYGPVVYEDFRNLRISKNLRAGEALTVARAQF